MQKSLQDKPQTNYPIGSHWIYIGIIGVVFLLLTVVFLTFPRSNYSELEKRDLATFPEIQELKENPSKFTADISHWFSDSEPFRDDFMYASMKIRDLFRYNLRNDDNAISYHPTAESIEENEIMDNNPLAEEEELIPQDNPVADENAKIQSSGIIVVGNPPTARAFMAFGGSSKSGGEFINTLNQYKEAFPDLNVYALVSSSPAEFYLPDKAKKASNSEIPVLEHIKAELDPGVIYVDAHSALASHTHEDIFLRTDHHWSPLGAYYAAEAFAKKAKINFKSLDNYDRKVVRDFVGTMYGYSKDVSIKQSPEDFVYYTPRDIDYKTHFITFKTNKNYGIISESKPYEGSYFKKYGDGNGGAYCTFMGGDQQIVKVSTNNSSGRKLLVIKDSFGNALPGYLFYGFDDIYIVDFRYFNKNMKDYVRNNNITDILITFNIFNACNNGSMRKVQKFLTQTNGNQSSNVNSDRDKSTDQSLENKSMTSPKDKKEIIEERDSI